LLTDPAFYAVSIPAVLLLGISKGGFGGGLVVVTVPLMSLVMSPPQAAGILLPLLCLADLMGLWAYRGKWVWPELRALLPASLLGIAIGTLLFGLMSTAVVKLIIGAVALTFVLNHWLSGNHPSGQLRADFPRAAGIPAGMIAGFTSFVAHSGGPPMNMYLLRRSLNRTEFVATTVMFFAVVNYVKLVPYAWLGQLATDNLVASLILAPFVPVGIKIGIILHERMSDRLFYRFVYLLLFVVALKLIGDGIARN